MIYDRRFDYLPFQIIGKAPRIGVFDPESVVEWERLD